VDIPSRYVKPFGFATNAACSLILRTFLLKIPLTFLASFSRCFQDFDKIKFTIKTKTGKEVSVQADRCGGDTSYAKVEKDGKEVFRHSMPDEEDKANVSVLEKEYPGAMVCVIFLFLNCFVHYFCLQFLNIMYF